MARSKAHKVVKQVKNIQPAICMAPPTTTPAFSITLLPENISLAPPTAPAGTAGTSIVLAPPTVKPGQSVLKPGIKVVPPTIRPGQSLLKPRIKVVPAAENTKQPKKKKKKKSEKILYPRNSFDEVAAAYSLFKKVMPGNN